MWVQLDDEALRKAEDVLRRAGEMQSADRIAQSIRDAELDKALDDRYRKAARQSQRLSSEDDVDPDAIVSSGADPGAYVMCWLWVRDEEAGIKTEADVGVRA